MFVRGPPYRRSSTGPPSSIGCCPFQLECQLCIQAGGLLYIYRPERLLHTDVRARGPPILTRGSPLFARGTLYQIKGLLYLSSTSPRPRGRGLLVCWLECLLHSPGVILYQRLLVSTLGPPHIVDCILCRRGPGLDGNIYRPGGLRYQPKSPLCRPGGLSYRLEP